MACGECGAVGVADPGECERLFQEVVGWEFGQPELYGVHRLTVDAYSLQHPDRYMRSAKSAAAHLAGMCWSLERAGGPAVSRALSAWLGGSVELPRVTPPAPGQRGDLTIRHVHDAGGASEHSRRVREWADSVWEAWEIGHEQARAWVRALTAGDRTG
jgi:hypothetical protein